MDKRPKSVLWLKVALVVYLEYSLWDLTKIQISSFGAGCLFATDNQRLEEHLEF